MSKKVMDKPGISRRSFIKGTGAAGLAAAVGPWVISPKALASSGEINILMWSDYLPPGLLKDFQDTTGITINYTGIGSNEEIINKMKATKGRGIDIVSPTNMRSPAVDGPGPAAALRLQPDPRISTTSTRRCCGWVTKSGTSTTRARIGCPTSGAQKACPGAPTYGPHPGTARPQLRRHLAGRCQGQNHDAATLGHARRRSVP